MSQTGDFGSFGVAASSFVLKERLKSPRKAGGPPLSAPAPLSERPAGM